MTFWSSQRLQLSRHFQTKRKTWWFRPRAQCYLSRSRRRAWKDVSRLLGWWVDIRPKFISPEVRVHSLVIRT
jgi:hypothetical protein